MSAPPEALMKLLAQGGGGGAPADAPGGPAGGSSGPAGGPMSTPQPKEGLAQAAMVNIAMVLQLLEQSLPAFGSATEQGKSVLNALRTLTNTFGKQRSEADKMVPAELMQLMQGMKGGPAAKALGGQNPAQPAIPQGV